MNNGNGDDGGGWKAVCLDTGEIKYADGWLQETRGEGERNEVK
jgi:hypothetical protein